MEKCKIEDYYYAKRLRTNCKEIQLKERDDGPKLKEKIL